MATTILVLLCVASEGFLVYVLVHFVSESRRAGAARATVGMVSRREAFGEGVPGSSKVIEITDWSRVSRRDTDRRKVS